MRKCKHCEFYENCRLNSQFEKFPIDPEYEGEMFCNTFSPHYEFSILGGAAVKENVVVCSNCEIEKKFKKINDRLDYLEGMLRILSGDNL